MIEWIKAGAPNIICMQFWCACQTMLQERHDKSSKRKYPQSNIVAVDYDPGASEVNQLNRIKLMLSSAFNNINDLV